METDRPQPDHDDDPRDSDTGAGYPEEQEGGANPGRERSDRESPDPSSPESDPGSDSDPSSATGNPSSDPRH